MDLLGEGFNRYLGGLGFSLSMRIFIFKNTKLGFFCGNNSITGQKIRRHRCLYIVCLHYICWCFTKQNKLSGQAQSQYRRRPYKGMNIRRHDSLGSINAAINQSALWPPWFYFPPLQKIYSHFPKTQSIIQ